MGYSLHFDSIMNPTHYESISVTWASIVWLSLLREILNNMCICEVKNFEINHIFLIKPSFLQGFKSWDNNWNILRTNCPSKVVKGNSLPINLVTAIFSRKKFSSTLVQLSSKLRLFAKQCNGWVCMFFLFFVLKKTSLYSNQLTSFDNLHWHELISFDYYYHYYSENFNQDENLELLTQKY